jgi:hypothetical protein
MTPLRWVFIVLFEVFCFVFDININSCVVLKFLIVFLLTGAGEKEEGTCTFGL